MRVFVTGASGYIGSALVPMLIEARHEVTALARSDQSAAMIEQLGATPVRGGLTDLAVLRDAAAASDGVIHLAFIHDFSKFAENGQIDKAAIDAMGDALAGSGKPLIVTSGVAMLTQGSAPATEEMRRPADGFPRVSEQAAEALVARGVRAMVVRLPQVHGRGEHAFTSMLVGIAREKGYAAYVGDGANRWPAAARLDAARVYLLALEKGRAGRHYHAVAEEGVALRDIAEAIGRGLNLPVRSIGAEEAADYFGWFATFAGMDSAASSTLTRDELGWHPTGPTLLWDLANEDYFAADKAPTRI